MKIPSNYWMQQTAHFKRGFDLIAPEILEKLTPKGYATATLVSDQMSASRKNFACSNQMEASKADRQLMRSASIANSHTFSSLMRVKQPISGSI